MLTFHLIWCFSSRCSNFLNRFLKTSYQGKWSLNKSMEYFENVTGQNWFPATHKRKCPLNYTKWLFSDRNLAFYYWTRKTLKSNSLVLKICLSLQKETSHTAEAVWCWVSQDPFTTIICSLAWKCQNTWNLGFVAFFEQNWSLKESVAFPCTLFMHIRVRIKLRKRHRNHLLALPLKLKTNCKIHCLNELFLVNCQTMTSNILTKCTLKRRESSMENYNLRKIDFTFDLKFLFRTYFSSTLKTLYPEWKKSLNGWLAHFKYQVMANGQCIQK